MVVDARGDAEHPLSRGYICPKGNGLPWNHHRPDRLNQAYMRGVAASAEHCTDDLAHSIQAIIAKHGVEAFGAYSGTGGGSGDMVSPRVFSRLLRAIGTLQVYTSSTVDNAPSWRAAEIVTGFAAEISPRWDPEDEHSKLVIFVGCNPTVSHGYWTILPDPARRIQRYQRRGGRVWVIDPRNTETARRATGHIAPKPGTDVFILAWLLREVLAQLPDSDLVTETTTASDLEALRDVVRNVDRDMVAKVTDVDTAKLDALLADVRAAGRLSLITGSGVNFAEHALTTELVRWAVLAVTGSLDQPGGMLFESGYGTKFEERQEWNAAPVGGALGPGAGSRPELFGMLGQRPSVALVDEIEAGTIKALLIAGGNPLTAFPEPDRMRAALRSLEVLGVVDFIHNPLTEIATHVFPSLGMLERSGVIAWNGRAAFTPAVVAPQPGRIAAWRVYARIAEALGLDILNGVSSDSAEELDLLAEMASSARFDFPTLRAAGTSGVPMPMQSGWVRRALPDGRWRIASPTLLTRLRALLENGARHGAHDGLILVNRRQVSHNNSTQYVGAQRRRARPLLQISPIDANTRNITDGDPVRIANATGSVFAIAEVTANIRRGVVSLPHGWFDANVSALISGRDGVDPLTGQPQMSGVPVTVVRSNTSAVDAGIGVAAR
jgi:anaerobic selenocysteine-containing dehydrogenase